MMDLTWYGRFLSLLDELLDNKTHKAANDCSLFLVDPNETIEGLRNRRTPLRRPQCRLQRIQKLLAKIADKRLVKP